MSDGEATMVKGILGLGEERLNDVVAQLLSNERFVGAMQGAISSGLEAKRSVDKNIDRLYAVANVPTLEDVEQVREKLLDLEDLLGDVRDRIVRLDEMVAERATDQRATKPRAAEKRTASKKAAPKKAKAKSKAKSKAKKKAASTKPR